MLLARQGICKELHNAGTFPDGMKVKCVLGLWH